MVTCPGCGETSPYNLGNRWRPFCSERCKMIDLGTWASDGYVVAGEVIASDDDLFDPETGQPRRAQGSSGRN
jgi:endogenous inhibitor of DNA gyrase (YacG/DUF329 family)